MACILVIEDDEDTRLLMEEGLVRKGHHVLGAANGREGYQLFSQSRIDLVVTDIFMPEEDGFTLINELNRDYPGVKIIAVSGEFQKASDLSSNLAETMGVNRTLAKPIDLAHLASQIEEVLAEESAGESSGPP